MAQDEGLMEERDRLEMEKRARGREHSQTSGEHAGYMPALHTKQCESQTQKDRARNRVRHLKQQGACKGGSGGKAGPEANLSMTPPLDKLRSIHRHKPGRAELVDHNEIQKRVSNSVVKHRMRNPGGIFAQGP